MISSRAYPSTIYAVIYTVAFWSWIAFEIWVFARERGAARDATRDRRSTFFVMLLVFVGIGLGLNLPQLASAFDIRSLFVLFFALGIALIYAGIAFRFWAIQTLGRFFRTRVMIQEQHQLITSGPYRYLRNPSYTAILLVMLGLGLGIGNWLSAILCFAVGAIAYAGRIALVEEPALARQFGQEFQDYKQRTWALIPFVW